LNQQVRETSDLYDGKWQPRPRYGLYKNLVIANRSRVNCAHKTSRALIITP